MGRQSTVLMKTVRIALLASCFLTVLSAGTFYLAMKYPQRWAAIAAIAPAAFGLQASSLNTIPKMPVMIVHGDMDTAVPVSLARTWVEVMKALKMPHQYMEVAGGDHGSVISSHQSEIFAFFARHSK